MENQKLKNKQCVCVCVWEGDVVAGVGGEGMLRGGGVWVGG